MKVKQKQVDHAHVTAPPLPSAFEIRTGIGRGTGKRHYILSRRISIVVIFEHQSILCCYFVVSSLIMFHHLKLFSTQ